MKAGKLPETVLERSVLKQIHMVRPEVCAGPAVGCDGALIDIGDEKIVCAVGAIPLPSSMRAMLNVYTACNNVLCRGAEPIGVLVGLMLPTSSDEQVLRKLVGELEAVCAREHMQLLGGHTEVTRIVSEPLITATAIGKVCRGRALPDGVRPGMDIVMAGWAGQAGVAILARERETDLRERYAQPFIDRAKGGNMELSVRKAALAAVEAGAGAIHDVSEGGVFGALWELGKGFGIGLEISLKDIPIRQETVEVSEFFHINPYKLISTGALLVAAEDGGAVVSAIRRAQGEAVVIGRVTDGNDRVLLCGEERRFLELPQTDEIYKAIRS